MHSLGRSFALTCASPTYRKEPRAQQGKPSLEASSKKKKMGGAKRAKRRYIPNNGTGSVSSAAAVALGP